MESNKDDLSGVWNMLDSQIYNIPKVTRINKIMNHWLLNDWKWGRFIERIVGSIIAGIIVFILISWWRWL